MRPTLALTFALLAWLPAATAIAAPPAAASDGVVCAPPRLVVVLDRSSSMNGAAGAITKWSAARAALDQVAGAYGATVELGLATFPFPDECGPGRLEVSPARGQRDALLAALATPPPATGAWTPLGETLLGLADEPALRRDVAPASVVVITDGFQWCAPYDPDARELPVDGVRALGDAGVTTYVVGFGGGVDVATLNRMAVTAGTDRPGCDPAGAVPGAPAPCYYQADDAAALVGALMGIAAAAAAETCDGLDNDCDGVVDEDACPPPGADAGADADAGLAEDVPGVVAGCGCGATPAGAGLPPALALVLLVSWRRRAARARRRPAAARR